MVHTQMKSMTSPRAIRTNSPIYSHQHSSGGWLEVLAKDTASQFSLFGFTNGTATSG